MSRISRTDIVLVTTALFALAISRAGLAQEDDKAAIIQVEAQPLSSALQDFSEQSGLQVAYVATLAENVNSKGTHDAATPVDALTQILDSTGLEYQFVNNDTVAIGPATAADEGGDSELGNGRTTAPKPVTMAQASQRLANTAEGEEGASSESLSSEEAEDLKLEEIIVVGSRLGGVSPGQSALPVKVITRKEIERSGAGNIAQVLSHLPEVSVSNLGDNSIGGAGGSLGGSDINATTVQLRGLPRGTTLILINGRRSGESSAFTSSGQFDLSTIPLALVERIEVLPAGASAVYGGDGLAGVINIVLRRDASGFDVRVRRTAADGYGASEASILWGKSWTRGQLTTTATWRENSALSTSERSLTADRDFSRFGGVDDTTGTANPGTVFSLDGCPPAPAFCFVPLEDRGNLPGLDAPFATVPADQDGQNLTPGDFAGAGVQNRSSLEASIFSPEKNYGLGLNGSIQVTSDLELFTEWMYSRRDLPAKERPLVIDLGQFGFPSAVVSATNPFNPFGVDVGINYLFEDTGIFTEFSQTYWRVLLGARGQLSDRWEWELAGWRSRDQSEQRGAFGFDASAITAALSSSDSASALNPFVGDGGAPGSQELLASMVSLFGGDFGTEQREINGFVRGPLIALPAGDVLGLVGGEYQKQTLSSNVHAIDQDIDVFDQDVAGGDTSRAIFGEVRIPIWASSKPERLERLALTGAFRRESAGRFEKDATTEILGLEFRPTRSLLLRASYSTAFKPPLVFHAVDAPLMFPTLISDPQLGGAVYTVEGVLGGGIPAELAPEIGITRSLGVVYSPGQNLRLSATAWETELRDRLATLGSQFIINNETSFPHRVVRDPMTGVIVQVDGRQTNIASTEVAGVDLALNGTWPTHYGDLISSLAASYTYKHRVQLTPASPIQDNLGVVNGAGWSPRWKIVPQVGWDYKDQLYATLTGRYVSAYRDSRALSTGPDAGTFLALGDFWMFDLNVDYAIGQRFARESPLLSDARLNIGARNMLNRLPDFCNGCSPNGYDASQYDIFGRTVYIEFRVAF